MTMLSFRIDDAQAVSLQEWAARLGITRSDLLREALRRQLILLAGEPEIEAWGRLPLDKGEESLAALADWGPAEDWSDWADAAG